MFVEMDAIRNKSGIYQIRNSVNNKVYIGSSKDLYKRYSEHHSSLRQNKHKNTKLQNAYNKYGENVWYFEILEYITNEDMLLSREQHYIDAFNSVQSGYNIAPIAGNTLHVYPSEETRKKMSIAQKGKVVSTETRKKLSALNKGRVRTPETKAKISKSNKGQNMGASNVNATAIICLETLEIYPAINKLCRKFGYNRNTISKCCSGKRNTVYGLHFMYLNDYNIATDKEIQQRMLKKNHENLKRKCHCIETNKTYDSIVEASRELGVTSTKITAVCRGRRNSTGGFHFRYV